MFTKVEITNDLPELTNYELTITRKYLTNCNPNLEAQIFTPIAITTTISVVKTSNREEVNVAVIILSPTAIEASHSGSMRQFELYAIITPTYSNIRCCMPSKW